MYSRQKTFSIGLSRDMIPEAHIVVWHIFKSEVIADSLNFFVNGTRLNNVRTFAFSHVLFNVSCLQRHALFQHPILEPKLANIC